MRIEKLVVSNASSYHIAAFEPQQEQEMKVLVIDDTELQREAAKAQLKDHDLMVVGDYSTAADLLDPDFPSRQKGTETGFEVVLTDLLMPFGKDRQFLREEVQKKFEGHLMPMGIFLVMVAAMRGVRYISIVSDFGSHDHPLAAAFQRLPRGGERLCINSIPIFGGGDCGMGYARKDDLATFIPYEERKAGDVQVKDWKGVLVNLVRYAYPANP